ncbi:MAG TPA: DUF4417 domain-containing protein [Jiangellaceae bacterium]|nr:DUF4417 domain-containing protein [Jiangellaceae bacterium]
MKPLKARALYPSSNEWGIPDLRIDRQAEIVPPVMPWGSRSRGAKMTGTWVFYVDDYRFGALEKQPLQLVATGCNGAAELNFTIYDQATRAEAIWATYRKRAVARQWQDAGINVLVDLNVPEQLRDLCLLGVPLGWRSFATRSYSARPEALRSEWRAAREFAGDALTMLVFSGGPDTEKLCRELPGTVYVPGHWETP